MRTFAMRIVADMYNPEGACTKKRSIPQEIQHKKACMGGMQAFYDVRDESKLMQL
jgi:hypothetical protein